MSYYRTFMPPKEEIEKLENSARRANSHDGKIEKIQLRTYCMLDHSNDKINDVADQVKFILSCLQYYVEGLSYKYAVDRYKEDDNEELWFCGWRYSHNEPDMDEQEALDYAVSKLTMLCCAVKTPDWFDDGDKFYEKLNEIDSVIEYYEDAVALCADFKIINQLKEYDTTDKYEDDNCDCFSIRADCSKHLNGESEEDEIHDDFEELCNEKKQDDESSDKPCLSGSCFVNGNTYNNDNVAISCSGHSCSSCTTELNHTDKNYVHYTQTDTSEK